MPTRVTFQFPTDREVRYLDGPPKQGELVKSMRDDKAVVTRVEADDGGYVVWCMRPAERALQARRLARRMRLVSAQLRQKTVESARQAQEQRERCREWVAAGVRRRQGSGRPR